MKGWRAREKEGGGQGREEAKGNFEDTKTEASGADLM